MIPQKNIRNFTIIAHIDHGKSTFADRLIQKCGAVEERLMKKQLLDSMDIERERGITIKAQTVKLSYKSKSGETYYFNLIDTPGHVDFSYEVSRSLAACEGSILIVDASQGVEAQTLANVYQAIDRNHEFIIALNKIDLPAADPERVKSQIEEVVGLDASDSFAVSAKTGQGVDEVLEAIITKLPAPKGDPLAPLQALLVDSWYDSYLGVITLIRVINGKIKKGMPIRMMATQKEHHVERIGIFTPSLVEVEELGPGDVGFMTASIKYVADCQVGDTIIAQKDTTTKALAGFKPSVPVVFCGLFPLDSSQYQDLRDSLEKLRLNDASFSFETENSAALGFGFRCGFLGLLHLEIIQERIQREFNIELLTTAPSVVYHVYLNNGEKIDVHNPADLPNASLIKEIHEPRIKATIMVPDEFLGAILTLCTEKRGIQIDLTFVGQRAMVVYNLPLNEVVFDFHDRLKSASKGYASFDYIIENYQEDDMVKLSILVNSEPVDALSVIVHRSMAMQRGREMCEKLKDLIPRQMFQIPIQAAVNGKVIARETIKAMRKDVLAKCYGGDISRKRKLLEKQKEGKKKMRQFGKVEIPHSAFIDVLKTNNK